MTQTSAEAPEVLGPDFFRDPYPHYARFREQAPVVRVGMGPMPVWLVVRYAEARAALTDHRLVKDQDLMAKAAAAQAGVAHMPSRAERSFGERVLTSHLLAMDPPDHTRLRGLVGRAFTMHRLRLLKPRIAKVAEGLLDAVDGQPEVDLLTALAYPMPVMVLCELLGVPGEDQIQFRDQCVALNEASADTMGPIAEEMAQLVLSWIARRRANPGEDLLTDLIQVLDHEGGISEEELVSMIFQVMSAGSGPSSHLIGNGMLSLLKNPEQLALLRADRSLLSGAVDEFARYETTVHISMPWVAADALDLGGVSIAAGDLVMVANGSANRDPAQFPDPDTFDIRRSTAGHIGFGHGIHHCLGASLGKLIAEAAVTALLDRYDRIELAVPSEEITHKMFPARLLERLPLLVG
ncbi:cytochrome P450 [Kitasatospora aureofaciens]|uniref:cytochrome P450 family protein n=1 Tax=Kitasatospora aureofaciens TaxID=1894 RepID=UPI001C451067|nr:cytochrome P450 [Kitasatospora aureofaciens]MBV6698101.1 cytochrome P450 [Kitasatospora aureofaciens]